VVSAFDSEILLENRRARHPLSSERPTETAGEPKKLHELLGIPLPEASEVERS
jgi:hypothetical protein